MFISCARLPITMTDEKTAILHICRTGAKTQFYTLYVERIEPGRWGGRLHTCRYERNLAFDLNDANENAEKWLTERDLRSRYKVEIQHHKEPRPIYATMSAFGADFKMNKRRTHWWANANEDFWAQWKKQKPAIKEAGYWVKRMEGTWLVFKRIDAGEMDFMDDKPPKDPKGLKPAPTPTPTPKPTPWFCDACDDEMPARHTKHAHAMFPDGAICLDCVTFYGGVAQ